MDQILFDISEDVSDAVEKICDALSERNVSLFLGAGVNYGIKNADGDNFPLGRSLSQWVCRDILETPELDMPLDDASEMARYRIGDKAFNNYLYEKLESFAPGAAHRAIAQLPWDNIYSTNFDLMVERAASNVLVHSAGNIKAVYSLLTDLSVFTEDDIIYYKLHGSIDVANSDEGRLILSKEDYRFYELNRKPLFKRLRDDLLSRTFLFVGYSLSDSNFRSILEDCRTELDTKILPLSFAVRPGVTGVERAFWREKYNIQLLDADATFFIKLLADTWAAANREVTPLAQRKSRVYLQADERTRFQKVGDCFYLLRPADCTGPSNAKAFFQGGVPTWGDIRDKVAPERDAYWTLFDAMLPELVDSTLPRSAYLVTGAAGTGKTTLVNSLVYELNKGFGVPVLLHIPSTPLDASALGLLLSEDVPRRVIVVVDQAASYVRELDQFMEDLRLRGFSVTVLLEERSNQWLVAKSVNRTRLSPAEFELGPLSKKEITAILDALERHHALGKLTGTPRYRQIEHFNSVAHKELLVALRELTESRSFDAIVLDEFDSIPSEVAKQAYVYVAALGQIDLPIRYANLVHLLNLDWGQLASELFDPAKGILISGEATGRSRHTAGFHLRARHPVIASIVFGEVLPDDNARFHIINAIVGQLDPGHQEDRRLLSEIVRRKELVKTLASKEKRRAVYERLASVLPNNPYVYQHRSILERDLGN